MAKLIGPLLSQRASGQVGKKLIYQQRRSGPQVRGYYKPNKPITLKQWTQRHIIGLITSQWTCMTTVQKQPYEDKAYQLRMHAGSAMSGFNYFIKVASKDMYTHAGLCGYWSLNENTGDTAFDYSGNGNHGILKPTYPSNCPARVASFQENYGNALDFDGVNDRVHVSHVSMFDTPDFFTIEAWIKTDDETWPIHRMFFSKEITPWYFSVSGERLFFSCFVGGIQSFGVGSTIIHAGIWYHAVAVADTITHQLRVYLNGVLDGTTNVGAGSIGVASSQLVFGVGNRSSSYPFPGLADEYLFFHRILPASEILKHYELMC
jgi:hypothetical protein